MEMDAISRIPRVGPTGQIVRWYGSVEDVDDRKRLEDALRKEQKIVAGPVWLALVPARRLGDCRVAVGLCSMKERLPNRAGRLYLGTEVRAAVEMADYIKVILPRRTRWSGKIVKHLIGTAAVLVAEKVETRRNTSKLRGGLPIHCSRVHGWFEMLIALMPVLFRLLHRASASDQ